MVCRGHRHRHTATDNTRRWGSTGSRAITTGSAGISVSANRPDFLEGASAAIPDVVRGRSTVEITALRAAYFPSTWTPLVFVDDSPLAVTGSGSQVNALAAIWWRAVREDSKAYVAPRAGVFREVIGAVEPPADRDGHRTVVASQRTRRFGSRRTALRTGAVLHCTLGGLQVFALARAIDLGPAGGPGIRTRSAHRHTHQGRRRT